MLVGLVAAALLDRVVGVGLGVVLDRVVGAGVGVVLDGVALGAADGVDGAVCDAPAAVGGQGPIVSGLPRLSTPVNTCGGSSATPVDDTRVTVTVTG